MTAAFTGLRMGELLALRWRDVDFELQAVRVRASYTHRDLGPPKNHTGRTVPMIDAVAQALARLGQRQVLTAADDLVFVGEDGGHLDDSALRRRFKRARDQAALRPLRFHDLRHAFGTHAIRTADPRELQEWMGHADFATTQIYLSYKPRAEAAKRLAEASTRSRGRRSTSPRRTSIGFTRIRAMATTEQPQRAQRLDPGDPRVARAVFTLRETAGLLAVPKSTIHEWARSPRGSRSLITAFPRRGREATVPFVGFAEAYVLAAFRRAGVPLQRIRPAVEILEAEIGLEHALASQRLHTDGAEVLYDYATKRDEGDLLDLVVVRTRQGQFSEVVKDYLRRITYGSDGWASRVVLPTYGAAEVVVNPDVAFGLPVVTHGGARVEDLVDRFLAGDSVAAIADDFDVPASEVEDVIRVATRTAA